MSGILDAIYLDLPEQWDALARKLNDVGIMGLDSEFYGLDVRKQSCVGRARIHVWSVAVRTGEQSPLGFSRARGWVLPGTACNHPSLKRVLEDFSIEKCVHNQPVDDHAFHNHGVQLRGCVNTLDLARWTWPHLVAEGGFGLKNLMRVLLRRAPVCEFKDVVSDVRTIQVTGTRHTIVTSCSCGVGGCKLRKPRGDVRHDKASVSREIATTRDKLEKFEYPLESINPPIRCFGCQTCMFTRDHWLAIPHPRWDLLVKYAAEDAVAALEIEELARAEADPADWPYGGERPGYNQDVADQVVLMERTGFRIDTAYAAEAAARAEADEEKELAWLHRWYVLNNPKYGPHRREETDAVWSSGPKKLELFDALEFPRSPYWKKGRVKPGEAKLDGAAMEWIAKNHPPAAQLLKHLLHLQRIRSGHKYLVKGRDCGGFVNPVCGPMGDGDNRNGAVTGRLGIKGPLESQQLPKRKEADLYQVRRMIIA